MMKLQKRKTLKNFISMTLSSHKKGNEFFCRDFVTFTLSLDENINLLYSI